MNAHVASVDRSTRLVVNASHTRQRRLVRSLPAVVPSRTLTWCRWIGSNTR